MASASASTTTISAVISSAARTTSVWYRVNAGLACPALMASSIVGLTFERWSVTHVQCHAEMPAKTRI
jgi:hypothetical protein